MQMSLRSVEIGADDWVRNESAIKRLVYRDFSEDRIELEVVVNLPGNMSVG